MVDVSGVSGAGRPQKIPKQPPTKIEQDKKILETLQFFKTLIPSLAALAKKSN